MTPSPPIMMPRAMTVCPKGDQWVAVSTVVSPVTQTADTAVKRTSTKDAGLSATEAKGSRRRAVMTMMMRAKTMRARRAGA